MIPYCIPSSSPIIPVRSQALTLTPLLTSHPRRRLFPNPHRPPSSLSTSLRRPPRPLSSPSTGDVIHFEDIVDSDWSFLESDATGASDEERARKARRIISAAEVRPDSRVLVSMGTEAFVDELVDSAPCELLLAVHDSLFALAMIKEKYDGVRCWQGGVDAVPEKFAPFDAVFLCYVPGMGHSIEELLGLLAPRCSPGAKLVISFDQGREIVKQHRERYPDMITSDLPDRSSLEKASTYYSFLLTEFVDEPNFYLAVLRLREP